MNGVIKSRLRKNVPRPRASKADPKKKATNPDASDDENSGDEADAPSPEQGEAQDAASDPPTPNRQNDLPASRLQILDIATGNPIMLYEDQLYSCSWTDMIGTNMFFTQPSGNQHGASLQSNADFDLTGTSRIKLVGRRASMVPKPVVRKRKHLAEDSAQVDGDAPSPLDRTSFPGFSASNWRKNIERKNQANFLDRLMQAKRARGETDIVTVLSDSKTNTIYRPTTDLPDELRLRIKNLNDRVVKGDARAVTSLKEIHSQLDDGIWKPNPNSGDANDIPTPNSVNSDQQPNDHG